MSLLVARMITPLIAAYFLRSHGSQPHAALEVDGCLSQDPELEPRYDQGPCPARPASARPTAGSAIMRSAPSCSCSSSPHSWSEPASRCGPRQARRGTGRSRFASRAPRRLRYRLRRGKLIGSLIAALVGGGFADWHAIVAAPLECAAQGSSPGDGRRRVRDAAAQRRPVRHPVDVLLPAAKQRLFAGQHHPAAGSTLKDTEAVDRPLRGDRPARPERRSRVRKRQRRQRRM